MGGGYEGVILLQREEGGKPMKPEVKEQRRLEAETRQGIYDKLSTKAKIALCRSRRGNSAKELARLEKLSWNQEHVL